MNSASVGAATSMLGNAHDIQSKSINTLMQSGAAAASAPAASLASGSDASQVRTQAMQDRGVGQNLNITA